MTLSRGLFTTGNPEWRTHSDLRETIDKEFGPLWDPCPGGTKDGLIVPWKKRVFCNPPYGRILPQWLKKGAFEMDTGHTELIVWLLPARTDPRWFHEIVFPRHTQIRFLRGRLHFNGGGPAPSPSMVVIWRNE